MIPDLLSAAPLWSLPPGFSRPWNVFNYYFSQDHWALPPSNTQEVILTDYIVISFYWTQQLAYSDQYCSLILSLLVEFSSCKSPGQGLLLKFSSYSLEYNATYNSLNILNKLDEIDYAKVPWPSFVPSYALRLTHVGMNVWRCRHLWMPLIGGQFSSQSQKLSQCCIKNSHHRIPSLTIRR